MIRNKYHGRLVQKISKMTVGKLQNRLLKLLRMNAKNAMGITAGSTSRVCTGLSFVPPPLIRNIVAPYVQQAPFNQMFIFPERGYFTGSRRAGLNTGLNHLKKTQARHVIRIFLPAELIVGRP